MNPTVLPPPSYEPINGALAAHQRQAGDWGFAAAAADLHLWAERFILGFKLEIGVPALMFERLGRKHLGRYRSGRNAFGLRDEIAIDEAHLQQSPYWRVLGTLAHELIHAWQKWHGEPSGWNYHNQQFRQKAADFGLLIDERGRTRYAAAPTPFIELLDEFGIERPAVLEPEVRVVPRGNSKLRLFMCPCGVKARIGRARFNARCLDCGELFAVPAE